MPQPTAELDLRSISERYFAAWEARDPDAIIALHAPDTRFWSHLGTEAVVGREAVRATFAELFERFPGFGFEAYRVLYGPDFWVLDWALTFRPEGRDEVRRFDCLDVVNVSADGLVARKDTFVDMVQLQAALPPVRTGRSSNSSRVAPDRGTLASAERPRIDAAEADELDREVAA